MRDFTVIQHGTDTSGRPILTTAFFWVVWQAVLSRPRVRRFAWKVVVVQAAFMARIGGGAAASAGYHDEAGALDVRTWNLTLEEQSVLWWEAALLAIIFWPRDPSPAHGGMDEHGHGCGGWDQPLAAGLAYQWQQARNRRDGLASNGPDYVTPRPPWVEFPPADLLESDYLMTEDARAQLDRIEKKLVDLDTGLDDFRSAELQRDRKAAAKAKDSKRALVARLGGLADQLVELEQAVSDDATKRQVRVLKADILEALAEDPDVDGPDNPAPGDGA